MSAFLGPIHFWLYKKIQVQEEMTKAIADCGIKMSWEELGDYEKKFVLDELKPLEELIDVGNIHGWLQERIHDAEGRYASLVTLLLREHPERLDLLKTAVSEVGERYGVGAVADAMDSYKALDDLLLNGMPCDRINALDESSGSKVFWHQNADVHGKYWEDIGGDPEIYYILRNAFVQGVLKNSRYHFTQLSETEYSIS